MQQAKQGWKGMFRRGSIRGNEFGGARTLLPIRAPKQLGEFCGRFGFDSRCVRGAGLVALGCKAPKSNLESLCIQGAELQLRAGDPAGSRHLERLARASKDARRRGEALRIALSDGARTDLAVAALTDSAVDVAVAAAVHLYKKTEPL